MNPLSDLYEFCKAHWGVITIASAWAVREWSTIGGWQGLRSWLKTGNTHGVPPSGGPNPNPDRVNAELQPHKP